MSSFEIRQPGGHLDQMMRQTRAHHVQLSQLADIKASVLLTTAAVVVPLTLRFLEHPSLRFPAMVMAGFSLVTVLLAAYGTMPKIGIRPADPNAADANLLFFASFEGLSYEEYLSRMERLMNDPSRVYEAQVREVYQLGRYLNRAKYRYIRMAYLCFIAGVLASTSLWAVLQVVSWLS